MAKSKKSSNKSTKQIINKINLNNKITYVTAFILIVLAICYYYFNGKNDIVKKYSDIQEMFSTKTTATTDLLKIHFIDVGQGDCIFIQFPDGKNMLIDGGESSSTRGDNGVLITNYLNNLKVDKINVLMATHQDSDHIGSLSYIFKQFDIEYCLRPFVYYEVRNQENPFDNSFNVQPISKKYKNSGSKTYLSFLKSIQNEKCNWSFFNKDSDFSQTFTYGESDYHYSADFLSPIENVDNIGFNSANDYSSVFILTYNDFKIMFTGDATSVVERQMIEFYYNYQYDFDIDVLKVGHHGSKTSSSQDFLDLVKPEYSIIMCGKNNKFGHPDSQVVSRLSAVGSSVYRSDLCGNIVLTVKNKQDFTFTNEYNIDFGNLIYN